MVYGILAVLVLFSGQTLGVPNIGQDFDEWTRAVGTPGTIIPGRRCRTDLLIFLDVSYSIGEHVFDNQIKPFLNNLVANPKLNVRPDGTNIAMIIFSNTKNTRVLLNFREKLTLSELQSYINGPEFTWALLSGDRTRTGLALELGIPILGGNLRVDVPKVGMVISDGEPRGPDGVEKETARAYANAEILRAADVSLVAAAIGHLKDSFKHVLVNITGSRENTFDAEFDELDTIVDKLVEASCNAPACHLKCTNIQGEFSAKVVDKGVYVLIPPPEAVLDVPNQLCLPVPPPHFSGPPGIPVLPPPGIPGPIPPPGARYKYYKVGVHVSVRTYYYYGEEVICKDKFIVKVKCGDTAFLPDKNKRRVCCCGKLLTKRSPLEVCCGSTLINKRVHICCDRRLATFVRKGRNCFY